MDSEAKAEMREQIEAELRSEQVTMLPPSRIFPHPGNPNRMSDEQYHKLRANIDDIGLTPPIIARSLECSEQFTDEFNADLVQILDGEHRMKYFLERGFKEVPVIVWKGIDDKKALRLLLTMNRLHGKDEPAKRRELVQELAELMEPEELAGYLPEDIESITRMINEESREAIANATEIASSVSMRTPFTIFLTSEQNETVKKAIRDRLDEIDPDNEITECRDGVALADICEAFLRRIV